MTDLSFIIPAHNEADHLPVTLPALRTAAEELGRPYEIIVVDDDSTDATPGIAAATGAQVLHVKLRHIAAVRNAGAAAAHGRYLIFVDADTTVPPGTLRAAWNALQQGAAAGGAYVDFDEALGPPWRFMLGLWNFISRTQRWAAGCFIFTRREAFDAAGGFDERFFAAEEIVLSERLKKQGPFTILREPVLTSARKSHSTEITQHLRVMLRTIATGGRAIQRREGLDIWYGSQRVESGK